MKHIIINTFGVFLGLTSQRVTIKENGVVTKEVALSRVKTIQVLSKGVNLSSNLIENCSARGVKIFLDSSADLNKSSQCEYINFCNDRV